MPKSPTSFVPLSKITEKVLQPRELGIIAAALGAMYCILDSNNLTTPLIDELLMESNNIILGKD